MVAQTSSRLRRVRLLLAITALVMISCGDAWSAGLDDARSVVVMINGKLDGADTFGAGIIFAARPKRVYIATAKHVIWRDDVRATNVKVNFDFRPGESYDATVLDSHDSDIDLAVISVAGYDDAQIPRKSIPFDILGDPSALKERAGLYSIGYANGKRWARNIDPDRFAGLGVTKIKFQSNFVRNGQSGGGLFDEHFGLVGMILKDEPPDAVACEINSVLTRLKEWGYPVDLVLSTAGQTQAGEVDRSKEAAARNIPNFLTSFDKIAEKRRSLEELVRKMGQYFEKVGSSAQDPTELASALGVLKTNEAQISSIVDAQAALVDTMVSHSTKFTGEASIHSRDTIDALREYVRTERQEIKLLTEMVGAAESYLYRGEGSALLTLRDLDKTAEDLDAKEDQAFQRARDAMTRFRAAAL